MASPVGGQFLVGAPAGFSAVTLGINDGTNPIFPVPASGNQTVVGAPGDTLQGGSGTQVLNPIQQFSAAGETIIGGSGPTTVYGGPFDSVVAGSGNTYIDGTAGKMSIKIGTGGTDLIV